MTIATIQMTTTMAMMTKPSSIAPVLALLAMSASTAQAGTYSYKYFFGEEMSARVACDRAFDETKRMAISAQLGEIVQSSTFQQCFDDSSFESDCHTHTDIYVAGKLGYIKSAELTTKSVVLFETGQACAVTAEIEVSPYRGDPDPSFQISAQLVPTPIFRSGEELRVAIESPVEAQVTVYSGISGGRFYQLESRYWEGEIGEALELPDSRSDYLWKLENSGIGRSFEKLWVVATKQVLRLPSELTEAQLFERLSKLPRDQWDSAPLGYQILPTASN